MKLVIVESPAKCKTINKYLGSDFVVLASYGHVRDLPSRNGSIKTEADFEPVYEVDAESEKKIKEICTKAPKCTDLYLATDPDREGEAISWHLLQILQERKLLKPSAKIHRIVFNEITKKAVLNAIANPREIDMNLVESQSARRALDYLVGYSISPILWVKLPGSRSAGRVQSVALKAICEREKEIAEFKIEEFWKINADFKKKITQSKIFESGLWTWLGKKVEKFQFVDQAQVNEVIGQIEKGKFFIENIEKKQVKRNPSPPFITSSLQQEASRKLGFSASRTMRIAQKLYEGLEIKGENVGLITYMRTDSVNLSQEALTQIRGVIEKQFGKEYLPSSPRFFKTKAKNAQEAHEAIRPTDASRTPDSVAAFLGADERRLYELIWKRAVASQMNEAILNAVTILIKSENEKAIFKATGSTIHFMGFYKLYREGIDDAQEEEELALPELKIGEEVSLHRMFGSQHFTEPPPRYNEATLVKKLEELEIGRPSTYASIISVIQDRNYAVLEQKRFMPENRGLIVTQLLEYYFQQYVEYHFTANLENELDEVAAGHKNWKELLRKFWGGFDACVQKASLRDADGMFENITKALEWRFFKNESRDCPKCKNKLIVKLSKYGAFISCSTYPDCDFRKSVSELPVDGSEGEVLEVQPQLLGNHSILGEEIWLKKGPYGFYLQMNEPEPAEDAKPKRGRKKANPGVKRVSIPVGVSVSPMEVEIAEKLLALPRDLGMHPTTGKIVKAGHGKFGPYLYHASKYIPLKAFDILDVTLEQAVSVIDGSAKTAVGAEPLRILGNHPVENVEIGIYTGRFGPYIKFQKVNVSLPNNVAVEEVTLEQALELIEKKKKTKKK